MPRNYEYNISPEDYQEILKDLEIRSLSLVDLSYSCLKDEVEKNPVKLDLKTDASLKKQAEGIATIIYNFTLTGMIKQKSALKISGKYFVEFNTVSEVTKEFLEVFKEYSLRLLMTPYLRDLFYNLSMRSDLPGIVLPLMKFFPTDKKLA